MSADTGAAAAAESGDTALAKRGSVYSFSRVHEAPAGFTANAPYMLALIALDDGGMVTAQLTDIDSDDAIAIGDRVEMVTRKLTTDGERGMIVYGYKFRALMA